MSFKLNKKTYDYQTNCYSPFLLRTLLLRWLSASTGHRSYWTCWSSVTYSVVSDLESWRIDPVKLCYKDFIGNIRNIRQNGRQKSMAGNNVVYCPLSQTAHPRYTYILPYLYMFGIFYDKNVPKCTLAVMKTRQFQLFLQSTSRHYFFTFSRWEFLWGRWFLSFIYILEHLKSTEVVSRMSQLANYFTLSLSSSWSSLLFQSN